MQRVWKLNLTMCQSNQTTGFWNKCKCTVLSLLLGEFKLVGVRSLSRFRGLRICFDCNSAFNMLLPGIKMQFLPEDSGGAFKS